MLNQIICGDFFGIKYNNNICQRYFNDFAQKSKLKKHWYSCY